MADRLDNDIVMEDNENNSQNVATNEAEDNEVEGGGSNKNIVEKEVPQQNCEKVRLHLNKDDRKPNVRHRATVGYYQKIDASSLSGNITKTVVLKPRRETFEDSQPSKASFVGSLDDVLDGPDGAAFHSRLPANKMTEKEIACFPDIYQKPIYGEKNFVNIRNRIIQKWIENPKSQLTFDFLFKEWAPHSHKHASLIKRIHAFLERHGFINFGIFRRVTNLREKKVAKVIVLGAGIAGLAVSQHLQHLGFEVVVLEARDRVGGRIATFRRNNCMADLGAQEIYGLWGNPLTLLSKQIGMDMVPMKRYCPLYDSFGKQIGNCKDEIIENEFSRLLESVFVVNEMYEKIKDTTKPLSLGLALEWLIKMQEKSVILDNIQHAKEIRSVQDELNNLLTNIHELKIKIAKKLDSYNKLKEEVTANELNGDNSITNDDGFKLKDELMKLNREVNKLNELNLEVEWTEDKMEKLETNSPAQIYLSTKDREIMNWNIASLEYILGTCLDSISVNHWDHAKSFDFLGSNTTVKNGCSCVPIAMTENLDIRLHTAAKIVKYYSDRVQVVTESTKFNNNYEAINGDLVVCTLPLGVLKTAIASPPIPQKQNNLSFEPSLPEWKQKAIVNLGFGVVNKVVLCFEKIFWDPNNNLFGHVIPSTSGRGELFLFTSVSFIPVLVGLFSGKSAVLMENIADEIIVERCIAILKAIFGDAVVPNPKETVVTRWSSDPYARGSLSYITTEGSPEDYDIMAKPVMPKGKEDFELNKAKPRLFFAGEHTIRNYPSTVHGAFLSGLREAGRIADFYLGYLDGTPENVAYNPFETQQAQKDDNVMETLSPFPESSTALPKTSSETSLIIFGNDSPQDDDLDNNDENIDYNDLDEYFVPDEDNKKSSINLEEDANKLSKAGNIRKKNVLEPLGDGNVEASTPKNRQKVLRNRTVLLGPNKPNLEDARKQKVRKDS